MTIMMNPFFKDNLTSNPVLSTSLRTRTLAVLIALITTATAWAEVGEFFIVDGVKYTITNESPYEVRLEQPAVDGLVELHDLDDLGTVLRAVVGDDGHRGILCSLAQLLHSLVHLRAPGVAATAGGEQDCGAVNNVFHHATKLQVDCLKNKFNAYICIPINATLQQLKETKLWLT